MNTKHDSFEDDLRALQLRALPPEWRAEVLRAAAKTSRPPQRTPRWLVAGWSLAWAATVALYLTTPAEPSTSPAASMNEATSPLLWQERAATLKALLAAN